ncbi:hypothetical protein HHI36_005441 [Cryptolaemus montrouzieri]|uniref:Uncharacterized protein n=1 Tax=Cryptolaemus montrouzieri TaxID=559131 RepID=A0ABD2NUN6_9CUCU
MLYRLSLPQVCCICENQVSAREVDSISIENHEVASFYCTSTMEGGGVLILARKDFKSSVNSFNISVIADQFFEAASPSAKVHLPENSYISVGMHLKDSW